MHLRRFCYPSVHIFKYTERIAIPDETTQIQKLVHSLHLLSSKKNIGKLAIIVEIRRYIHPLRFSNRYLRSPIFASLIQKFGNFGKSHRISRKNDEIVRIL